MLAEFLAVASAISLPLQPVGQNVFAGSAQLSVSEGRARASAPRIRVGAGHRWQVSTCITVHVRRRPPATRCESLLTDTRRVRRARRLDAPAVSVRVPDAPGWVSYVVYGHVDGGRGDRNVGGTSWPKAGVRAASVRIGGAPQPPRQGVRRKGERPGIPDAASIDSPCLGEGVPGPTGTTVAGVPVEIDEPEVSPPKGTVVLMHGGGWYRAGPRLVASTREEAERWHARGWRTVNVDYRPCAQALRDSWAVVEAVRASSSAPICLLGESAGGHMAMLIAALRTDIACVVSMGGIADGALLARQRSPLGNPVPPRRIANYFASTFGAENVAAASPSAWPIGARVLYGIAEKDPLVPVGQLGRMQGENVVTMQLAAGEEKWVHANVDATALADFVAREDALAEQALRPLPPRTLSPAAQDAARRLTG